MNPKETWKNSKELKDNEELLVEMRKKEKKTEETLK